MDFHHREILKRYARVVTGRPFAPILLNVLVTSICDMRCVHCFFTDELDDRPRKKLQMKTHEVERISETLGANLGILVLAGGEPFTRRDLPEIARAFYENNKLETVYVMSNGQIQERILPDVERMLEECPGLKVTVALGIDGLEPEHDAIRRKPGSWALAIDTARRLQSVQSDCPRLSVETCTCVMRTNQDRIFDWYDFLRHELRPDRVKFNYIRPPAPAPEELDIDLGVYRTLTDRIADDAAHPAPGAAGEGFLKAAVDRTMHELIARTALEGRPQLRCFAGDAGGVIYDDGTVSSCENLPPVGNLRDHDWNFASLWYSPEMNRRRERVADGCFCTHESNCYYPSLAFNPQHLVRIKKLERDFREAAQIGRRPAPVA